METKSNSVTGAKPRLVRLIFRWLFLVAGAVALFLIGLEVAWWSGSHSLPPVPQSRAVAFVLLLVHVVAVAFILALVAPIFRRMFGRAKWSNRLRESLFTWRTARRALIGLAVLATLIAVFYAEENWRGKRAWEQCKRDLQAKGEVLDWAACIPAPIPDDENIIKAPKMTEWFVKPRPIQLAEPNLSGSNGPTAKLYRSAPSDVAKRSTAKDPILLARVAVLPPGTSATNGANAIIPFDAPDAQERLATIVHETVGPSLWGVQGNTFVRQPLSQIKPVRILLLTDQQLSVAGLSQAFPAGLVSTEVGILRVESDADRSTFRVILAAKPTLSAEEYLAWSDQAQPELDLIREGLKRPRIRMDGDFQRPFEMPIVNFVCIRNVAQVAAQRAQCCLLLGRSEQAFRELSLIFELRRLLAAKPTTLVAAMIDVAISGLYAEIVAEGFRMQAWREPELVALQEQLQQINLLPEVVDAFRSERAAVCHSFETDFRQVVRLSGDSSKLPRRAFSFLHAWVYQNITTVAKVEQQIIETFDPAKRLVQPSKQERVGREIAELHSHWSPYTLLAAIAVPNFVRATQTTARNQTLGNQALIVCGLERYRLAHGGYPETLDALVPQFLEKLPPDIIGGQPLHYRRTPDGKFLLYSVGWNEKDDGGESSADREKGDWVWPMTTK